MKQRIWELDTFRGICILGMLIVHFIYDVVEVFGLLSWDYPPAFLLLKQWGGVFFLLLSGICVTLGTKHIRRGCIVFLCGLVCTAVTGIYARFTGGGSEFVIWFGVLHCLGLCMLLWEVFRKAPSTVLVLVGVILAVAGIYLNEYCRVSHPWLIVLGVPQIGFAASDYFPLLPHFGFFLLGAGLGRLLYRNKQSLFPKVSANAPAVRFFSACGRHSLLIYLLHQPVFMAVLSLISLGGNL